MEIKAKPVEFTPRSEAYWFNAIVGEDIMAEPVPKKTLVVAYAGPALGLRAYLEAYDGGSSN